MLKPRRPGASTAGFTLVEILVATSLVGIVMAMAMMGFTQAKKSADLSRSMSLGATEASTGLREIVSILRRSSVVYFTGDPLAPQAANVVIPAPLGAIPPLLRSLPSGNPGPSIHFNPQNPAGLTAGQTDKFSSIATFVFRNSYRFQFPGGGVGFRDSVTGAAASRLFGSQAAPGGANYFSAPLLYCADAVMGQNMGAGGTDVTALVPVGWYFYVIYLAPMDLAPTGTPAATADADPLVPVPGILSQPAIRDRGGVPGVGVGSWPRSIVPYELRLLTIRGAVNAATNPKGVVRATNNNNRQTDQNGAILPVPWDIAIGDAIYDPVAIGNTTFAGGLLTNGFQPWAMLPPYNNPANKPFCEQHRVKGAAPNPHTNFGSIGNDPPTNEVLATASAADCSDRVLIRYIDPDNPNGTFVKFVNPYTAKVPAAGVPLALAGDNRLVDTYEGGFERFDFGSNFPSRAVVSVTTRFRTTREIPFQFSTKTEEVSLETSRSYNEASKLRWSRN